MTFSVIVPIYNLSDYVEETLQSVQRAVAALNVDRPGDAVECICVDDGSSDATPERLRSSAEFLARACPSLVFRVVRQENGGEGRARNAGLRLATGEWLTFLDGDDVWSDKMLVRAAAEISAHPGADMVAFRLSRFYDGESPAFRPDDAATVVDDVEAALPSDVLREVGIAPTFFRADCIRGLRFEPLPLGSDRLYVANALCRVRSVARSRSCLYGYRMRQSSMAHAAWGGRKIASQCDYAVGSLRALVRSGKRLGREGQAYLASLWLSDVPNRLRRLASGVEKSEAWRHWRATLSDGSLLRGLPRHSAARRLLRVLGFSMNASLAFAWTLRKLGLT